VAVRNQARLRREAVEHLPLLVAHFQFLLQVAVEPPPVTAAVLRLAVALVAGAVVILPLEGTPVQALQVRVITVAQVIQVSVVVAEVAVAEPVEPVVMVAHTQVRLAEVWCM
jgi:hypothetical protein